MARLAALKEVIQSDDRGIDRVIRALSDPVEPVRRLACRLLRQAERGQDFLLNHQLLGYFTTFADWQIEPYDLQVGITDPEMHAYAVRMVNTGWERTDDLSQFEALLQDPKVTDLQALVEQGVSLATFCHCLKALPSYVHLNGLAIVRLK